MTRLKDENRTVELELRNWTGSEYTPDISADFFEVGGLPYDAEAEAYIVYDVEYCIDYAFDWKYRRCDFASDEFDESVRCVFVWEA